MTHAKQNFNLIVGKHDKNAYPKLSENYLKLLQKNNISSNLLIIEATHRFYYIGLNADLITLRRQILN